MPSTQSARCHADEVSGIRRDGALDGLRAVAALSVVAFHVWLYTSPDPTLPTREGFWNRLLFEGRIGLVLFFVLSGFLLFRRRYDLRRSLFGRPRRTFPGSGFRLLARCCCCGV